MTEEKVIAERNEGEEKIAKVGATRRVRRKVREALQPPSAGQAENHQPGIQSSAPRRVVTPELSIPEMEKLRDDAAAFIKPGSADPVAGLRQREELLAHSPPQSLENFVADGVVVKKCFLNTGVHAGEGSRFLYMSLQDLTAETAGRALTIIATKKPEERMAALEEILPKYALFFDLRPDQALPLVALTRSSGLSVGFHLRTEQVLRGGQAAVVPARNPGRATPSLHIFPAR